MSMALPIRPSAAEATEEDPPRSATSAHPLAAGRSAARAWLLLAPLLLLLWVLPARAADPAGPAASDPPAGGPTTAAPRAGPPTTELPSADVSEEADLHFKLGTRAYLAGQYEEALDHLLRSNRLAPNRNVLFNIGMTYVQLGRYDAAYRHLTDFIAHEERPDVRASAEAVIEDFQDRVALLQVTSDPPGAEVFVDRRDLGTRGRTPLTLALSPGDHTVLLDLPGHQPAELPAKVVKGEVGKLEAALQAIRGTVRVQGTPEGAQIRLGHDQGEVLGAVPTEVSLPAGTHVLVVSAPSYATRRELVEVRPNARTELLADLEVLTGRLVVGAVGVDALIEIDGQASGFAPAVLDVPAGSHVVRVSARRFEPYEATVEIVANQSTELDVHLAPAASVTAASRTTEAVEDAPASVSLITAEEIRAFGYLSLYEALGGTRGVFGNDDLTYQFLGFRGFSRPGDYGNRVLTTLDGHVMNDDQLGASYVGTDLVTDLGDVSQIEVVRGAGSALYGSNAFFGVVNVATHDRGLAPRPHAALVGSDAQTVRARIGAGTGDRDLGAWFSIAGLGSVGNTYTFSEFADASRFTTADGTIEGQDGSGAGTAHVSAWVRDLTLHAFFHGRVKEYASGAYETRPGDPRALAEDQRGFAEVRYEPAIGSTTRLYARGYVDTYRFDGQYPYYPRLYVDTWRGSWGGVEPRLVTSPAPWLELTVGAEVRSELRAAMRSYVFQDEVGGEQIDQFLDETPSMSTLSGYLLGEVGPPQLRVHVGGRYDRLTLPDGAPDDHLSALSPRLAVVSHPASGTAVKLMAGQAFRAPSAFEYLYADGISQVRPVGLVPETSRTAEVELTQRLGDSVSAVVAVFANQIEDLVDTELVPETDVFRYTNVEVPTRTAGAEVELRREWRDGWMAAAQYSAQRTRLGDLVEGQEITNSPGHLASLKLAAPVTAGRMTAASRIVVESPRLTVKGDTTDWVVAWDATLTGQLPGLPAEWTIGGRNLLGWDIEYPGGYDVPLDTLPQGGRSVMVRISAEVPPRAK